MLRSTITKLGSIVALSGGAGTIYALHQNDYELSNVGLIRFSRAGVAAASIIADYKYSLYNLAKDSTEYQDAIKAAHTRSAAKILRLCEKNGGVFIKVGQHIAAMEYLIPIEYTSKLCSLHSHAPVTQFEEVKKMVETNLKAPLEEVFSEFDVIPVGSASLAQVHRAVIRESGECVAVKVQHPKVKLRSVIDMGTMEFFCRVTATFLPQFKLMWLVEETKLNLPNELDFLHEAKNADVTRRMFSHLSYLIIPQIKWKYSTTEVLTMQFCEGAHINDLEYMKKEKIDAHDICSKIGRLFSEMIFEKGYIHADIHIGNFLVKKVNGDVKLILLDHGLYLTLKDDFRVLYSRLWLALLKPDKEEVKAISKEMGVGDLYNLFACIVTSRSWDSVQHGIHKRKLGEKEIEQIAEYAGNLIPQISEVLSIMPREMLLILKTNDLIRSIEHRLGVAGRADSFIEMARFCVKSVYCEKLRKSTSYLQNFTLILTLYWRLFKIFLYTKILLITHVTGLA
uniref:ABC1 domain-containing protein n=1 Tax=Rhabditophanes sp. KR3021 TaxID=114890 RepID=A0AC35TVF2_9BILA